MSQAYKAGDILRVVYSGLVDGETKRRRVLFWLEDVMNPSRILVSGIYGTATQGKWECRLYPNQYNGLTKDCVVRIDNTRYIQASSVLELCGTLNPIEFSAVKNLMMEYSSAYKANSPEDFDENPFGIF